MKLWFFNLYQYKLIIQPNSNQNIQHYEILIYIMYNCSMITIIMTICSHRTYYQYYCGFVHSKTIADGNFGKISHTKNSWSQHCLYHLKSSHYSLKFLWCFNYLTLSIYVSAIFLQNSYSSNGCLHDFFLEIRRINIFLLTCNWNNK